MHLHTKDKAIDVTTAEGAAELEASVVGRLGARLRDFRLVVTDKGVILRGQAHTYHVKQLAQHAVMRATPLPIVANEIAVP